MNLKNIPRGRPCTKLDWLHGKYTVLEKIAPMVYKLDVPGRIHPNFHMNLLRRAHCDPLPSQKVVKTIPVIINDEEEWEVDEILCAAGTGESRVAWCKWTDWDVPDATKLEFVKDTRALDEWEAKYGDIHEHDGPREQYLTATGRLKARWKRFNDPRREEGDGVMGLPPWTAQ